MGELTLVSANEMPAPTWHRLSINSTDIAIPANLFEGERLQLEVTGARADTVSFFDDELLAYQNSFKNAISSPKEDSRAVLAALNADADPKNLDVCALSSYQRHALIEESKQSIVFDFASAIGSSAYEALKNYAKESYKLPHFFYVPVEPYKNCEANLMVESGRNEHNLVFLDLCIAAHASLKLSILLNSQEDEPALTGVLLRVLAREHSSIDIDLVQTCAQKTISINDTSAVLADGSTLHVSHSELGAKQSFTGLYCDLRGNGSRVDIDTRYVAFDKSARDFNYRVCQRGKSTVSLLEAKGVLLGASQKTLRGTIDLVHGCKGSSGCENETVIIADKRARNKTVPLILCDEDDVSGNHGATIGNINPDQQFYLQSRGLSEKQIEALFVESMFENALNKASNQATRQAILNCGQVRGFTIEEN